MQVHGDEVDARADVFPVQCLLNLVPALLDIVDVDQECVQVSGMDGVGPGGRRYEHRQIAERIIVPPVYLLAASEIFIYARELVDAERRLQIRHIVFIARVYHLVMFEPLVGVAAPGAFAHAVKAVHLYLLRPLVVVGGHHSTLAGDDVLRHVKAEAGEVADGPDFPPLVHGLYGVGRILYDEQVVVPRDFEERVHVAWTTGKMNGDERPRFFGDLFPYFFGVYVHRAAVDIRENRDRPDMRDHVRGSCEGQG